MAKSNNIEKLSGYELMRRWFGFAFENQDKVCPTHTAMFAWFVELNNRMGWAEKFASPASQTMGAISLKSYNTYKKVFDDLVRWKFVTVVSESKNQWSACIIALSNFNNAKYKALDNAMMAHYTEQSESTVQSTSESIDSINKPLNHKPINHKPETKEITENLSQVDVDLSKKIMDWFGFTESANFDKLRKITDFQKCLTAQGKEAYFKTQFDAYVEFKSLNPIFKHSFSKFLGDKKILYEDGKWDEENWTETLKIEKSNGNGNGNTTSTAATIEQRKADRDGLGNLAADVLAKIAAEYSS